MDIEKPTTFSEKIQWLKKHGLTETESLLADKYDVRKYVEEKIGSEYLIELLPLNSNGQTVVDNERNIDWNILPDQFALKLTKGSGFNIICADKSKLTEDDVKNMLHNWLKVNNYYLSREPHYKGKNKIIAEKLLEYNIKDYKFFCFGGEPFMFKVDVDRFVDHRANYYDMDLSLLDLDEGGCPRDPDNKFEKPDNFDEMVEVARKLSEGWPFVRIDLYVHAGKVYFGEITFHPAGGYAPLSPREWEYKLGEKIKI
ncbi:MAG: glycosyl transferase [Bacteroidales bacterium]|nr:glycosyl transferase [Bacteroidales bacterium]